MVVMATVMTRYYTIVIITFIDMIYGCHVPERFELLIYNVFYNPCWYRLMAESFAPRTPR